MTVHVLIVGETAQCRAAVERSLDGLGIEVLATATGNEALELLCDWDVAFVLISHQLPDMEGVALAGLIQGDRDKHQIPTLLITTDEAWEATSYRGYEKGILDYVAKPLRRGVVRAKARTFLRLHAAREREHEQARLLEQSNREFREFAHAAAHDLQAPLRAVTGYLDLLDEAPLDDEPQRARYSRSIKAAVQRMRTMITSMLEHARVDREPLSQLVDLNVCLSDALADLGPALGDASAEVEVDFLPRLSGSMPLLRRLFQNILHNAVKYRRPSVDLQIRVSCVVASSAVQVNIRDNGTGFDMSRHDEVFAPFRRLVGSGEVSGSGIGLATAKRIVAHHGGTLNATSVVGEGSTFHIRLPMTVEELSAFRRMSTSAIGDTPPTSTPKVLVAEDCDTDRDLLRRTLSSAFEVIVVDCAERALSLLDTDIAIVVTDYRMPGADGVWLLEEAQRRAPNARRVLMTSSPDERCRIALKEGVAERLLHKPVDAEDLRFPPQAA